MTNKQRVLVLQGGGALGAYELGVFQTLSEKLPRIDMRNDEPDRKLFDIIAGTSIGAINAAILVGNYVKHRSWNESIRQLEGFWKRVKSEPEIDFWIRYWDELPARYENRASREAARRYYSAKQFLTRGAPNVFTAPEFKTDDKFFDNGTIPNNIRLRHENEPLKESIADYVDFPIATKKDDPRLLLVSVDIVAGTAVTFDSHSTKSEYWTHDRKLDRYEKHKVEYPDGIQLEHVMASAAIPIFYDYVEIEERKFWDGSFLNNTPLREVIRKHNEFWMNELDPLKLTNAMWVEDNVINTGIRIPDLEAYIVSLWPGIEKTVPDDNDGLRDRVNDIAFSDKTEYDERSATLVTDYIDLVKRIRNLAVEHFKTEAERKSFRQAVDEFLNKKARSVRRDGNPVTYENLVKGRFRLTKVVRIEREDDAHGISNKFADFSRETIEKLTAKGKEDADKIVA